MIGTRIKKIRILRRLKQNELAGKLGITQQAYSKIERSDNMTLCSLRKICTLLNVKPIFIIDTIPVTKTNLDKFGNKSIHAINPTR